jgi:predicted Zn-dependent peptidase
MEFDAAPALVEPALRAVLDGLARLGTSEVSDADLEYGKMQFLRKWQEKLSSSPGIARAIATYFQEGLAVRDIATLEQRVRAVTAARLRDLARRYLSPERLAIVVAGAPGMIGAALERVGTVTWVDEVDPKDFPSQYWDELRDAEY